MLSQVEKKSLLFHETAKRNCDKQLGQNNAVKMN